MADVSNLSDRSVVIPAAFLAEFDWRDGDRRN